MQYKSLKLSNFKKNIDISDEIGDGFVWFSGYASVFDVQDAYGDIVKRGAFINSLNKRKPILLYQHNTNEPIGKIKAREDDYGLFVDFAILKNLPIGKTAISLVDNDIIDGLSIGYNIIRSTDLPNGGKELQELDLYEVSIVTFPANDASRIINIEDEDEPMEVGLEDWVNFLNSVKSFNDLRKKGAKDE